MRSSLYVSVGVVLSLIWGIGPVAAAKVGDTETYTFRIAGKVIGTQTAQLTSVRDDGAQAWKYAISLKVPTGSKTVDLEETGRFAVDSHGLPLGFETSVKLGKKKQGETLKFDAGKVGITLDPAQEGVPSMIAVNGSPYLLSNNNMTAISIVSRATRPSPTGTTTWQVFSSNVLQPVALTLTATGADTVTVGGAQVPCHVFTVFPIQNRFWISDTTGDLLKDVDTAQKLEIVRE